MLERSRTSASVWPWFAAAACSNSSCCRLEGGPVCHKGCACGISPPPRPAGKVGAISSTVAPAGATGGTCTTGRLGIAPLPLQGPRAPACICPSNMLGLGCRAGPAAGTGLVARGLLRNCARAGLPNRAVPGSDTPQVNGAFPGSAATDAGGLAGPAPQISGGLADRPGAA